MVTLNTVEIPGYAEAIKKEQRIRDTAFLDGLEIVCGVEVRPISLRRLIWLEQARNGFVVACRFDSYDEMLAHALQVVYFCSPKFKLPKSPAYSFWGSFMEGWRQNRFFRRVLRKAKADSLIEDVETWLRDSFMDAPTGSVSDAPSPSYASYPAYIMDKFAEAGLPFTYDEVMDMPMRRLWQHWRVAVKRIDNAAISNPSDVVACEYLAGVRQ